MKKIFTILIVIGTISSASAQLISQQNTPTKQTAVSLDKIRPLQKTAFGGKKWFNYGLTMNDLFSSSVLNLFPCFPDTTVVVNDGSGTYFRPFIHNVATILDPASENFASTAAPGDIVVYKKPYTLDSVGMLLQYVRNMDSSATYSKNNFKDTVTSSDTTLDGTDTIIVNRTVYNNWVTLNVSKTAVVDTLIMEAFSNNSSSNYFTYTFTDPAITNNYNTDSLFIISPRYNFNQNAVVATGKKAFKVPLDKAFYETMDADGLQYLQIATALSVNSGRIPAISASFKPGYKVGRRYPLNTTNNQTVTETRDTMVNMMTNDTTFVIDSVITNTMDININPITVSPDTLDNLNYTNFLSFEEQGTNTFPTYIKRDNNSSAVVETTVRYNSNPGGWNPYFIPTYAFTQVYALEHHWFDFLLNCPTCIGTSVANEFAGFSIGTAYPNPAVSGEAFVLPVTLSANAEKIIVTLNNALGQMVTSTVTENLYAGEHTLSLGTAGLEKGIYFYTVEVDGSRLSGKVFIAE